MGVEVGKEARREADDERAQQRLATPPIYLSRAQDCQPEYRSEESVEEGRQRSMSVFPGR